MYRVAIAIVALLLLITAVIARDRLALLVLGDGVTRADTTAAVKAPAPRVAASPRTAAAAETVPADPQRSTFDVVRVDPDGASVFAGRAPPKSDVTILANGEPVATASADDTGAWAAVTEHKFAPAEYEFALRAKSAERGEITEGQRARVVLAPSARVAAPAPVRSAASLTVIAPPPITFLYNEAAFTPEGRKAVAKLAEYLVARGAQKVSLSGHADERGSDPYNLDLSRQRLDAVAAYLREHGFAGQLELIAKGKSEPFGEVDRRALPRDAVLQADRRVQLRATR